MLFLEQLAPVIEYDDGLYSGTLSLDHTSLHTEATGYSTRSYTVSETKTISQLDRNDMSYVPATTIKDGVTLNLAGVDWQVTGTDLVGEVLPPPPGRRWPPILARRTIAPPTATSPRPSMWGTLPAPAWRASPIRLPTSGRSTLATRLTATTEICSAVCRMQSFMHCPLSSAGPVRLPPPSWGPC